MLLQLLWLRHLSGGASPLNGLGATPQMGYNSWYDLMCTEHMNEATIRGVADALVKTGLARAGFVFVNLDDCYIKDRLPNGTLAPDPKTFPSGMRSLANYIHNVSDCQNATCADTACADCTCEHAERNISLCNYSASAQLRFGVYTDRGSSTCAGRPAAQGHEAEDARTYAEWQVDYLKEDSCHAPSDQADAFRQYGLMRDSLNQTGRPIFFSLCGWNSWYAEKGASLGNSWRVGPDDSNWQGIIKNIDIMAGLTRYAGKNKGWNDPCLLLSTSSAGKQLVTEYQSRSQFSMWSVMSAPLLISGSILNMSTYTLETYLNRDVIAVNQDSLGVPGERVAGGDLQHCAAGGSGSGSLDCTNVWAKPLQGPSAAGGWPSAGALVFFNAGAAHADVRCDKACWAAAGFDEMLFPLYITDLWNTSDVRLLSHPEFTASQLPPRGGFRMVQVGRPPQVTELPHLSIPHCKNGNAVATNFKNDRSPPPSQAANQSTTVRMCWNRVGLQVSTNASDTNIFNTATQCNAPVFSTGDVLEVFVGPVRRLADVPAWYLELDTASSGALWGMLAHNPLSTFQGVNHGGSDDSNMGCQHLRPKDSCMFNATYPCSDSLSMAACMFKCSGKSDFVHGLRANVTLDVQAEWWHNHLTIPWGLFPSALPKDGADGQGWRHWRLNLYRYDYGSSERGCDLGPRADDSQSYSSRTARSHCKQEELSAWSSSGEGNFHLPQWFGSATLLDE